MDTNAPDEIIEKWKRLEDVDQERERFVDYTEARDRYLAALQGHVRGEVSNSDFQKALRAEIFAFDAYVAARTHSTFRSTTN